MNNGIKDILIVGGGTAGWMTAAALTRMLDTESVNIRLVESDAIGTVGVGEATLPSLIDFNRMLGFDEAEIMRETAATIKYGIAFNGWTKEGESYFHPFGDHGYPMEGLPFHQYWLRARSLGKAATIEEYCLTAMSARYGKAAAPVQDIKSPLSMLAHAYQFDASLYAAFLRKVSEARGLERLEGRVTNVNLTTDTGFINSVTLDDGRSLSADLFIDCSGFRALLLGQALDVEYQSWAKHLPVDAAVTVQTTKTRDSDPYTTVTARKAGWQWHIPLQHRTGNGHVYCSQYMDAQEAEDILTSNLFGEPATTPRHIKFTTGRRNSFWERNCVGIGLSSGFLEPLESTSIYLIQTGIKLLISLFPDKSCSTVEAREYNNVMTREYEQIRDFLILHYAANERQGEPFWDYLRTMDIPKSLQQRIDLFAQSGRIFRYDGDLFSETSWIAVLLGQGIIPKTYNAVIDCMPDSELLTRLTNLRSGISKTTKHMPSHEEFMRLSGASYSSELEAS